MGEPALLVFFYVSLGLFGCGASLSRHSAQHVQFVVEEIQMNEIAMENAVPTAIDPPPHELAAKMARYIVHSSGKFHNKDFNSLFLIIILENCVLISICKYLFDLFVA